MAETKKDLIENFNWALSERDKYIKLLEESEQKRADLLRDFESVTKTLKNCYEALVLYTELFENTVKNQEIILTLRDLADGLINEQ